ncbi:ergothioneine biosynthesis protein EgtB [Croceiramulus getboli]|nr:ergothioneine biosynthesis protein EgtB [Flavobacteriaceae bacterium YJPT1-3]
MIATETLLDFFITTRQHSERLCQPLAVEDYVVQPIVDVSPPKWHLGHTSWFFEEFLLKPHKKGYPLFNEEFDYVFNSYYESVGKRVVRTDRGNLSRPTVDQVYAYRRHVDRHMQELLERLEDDELRAIVEIGIHHEKQHQELLLTDIKYILGHNPLLPVYDPEFKEQTKNAREDNTLRWIEIPEGVYEIGHQGSGFCYDNELARHKVYLHDFEIANRLVTQGEYLDFMNDGGYQKVLLWHSDGWAWIQEHQIKHPMYWHQIDGSWQHYTLSGLQPLDLDAPLCHLSYYEAFAFAQWKGARLPTEFEWEAAQAHMQWGDRWEWTESAYLPYPGYQKAPGALGEYNGKFMVNQKVLRGGSVATPPHHTRPTYRNFFQPELRWQFTGLRLAK